VFLSLLDEEAVLDIVFKYGLLLKLFLEQSLFPDLGRIDKYKANFLSKIV
jgi:hypothetical protein